MALQEIVKESLLKNGEAMVKAVVNDVYDPAFLEAKEALKLAIPGQVDDAIIELIAGVLQPQLKALLLAQVEKIHEEAVAAV
jgi:hypothetical protein